MHELYIAQCILRLAADSLPEDMSCEGVSRIDVTVGQLDAVVPENLIFLFDAVKKSYQMPRARLALQTVGALCQCRQCQTKFSPTLPMFLCPECGSGSVEVTQGRGISLTRIEVECEDD